MTTKLKEKLAELGLSQSEAARRSGVDAYRLSKYATGAARPGSATIQRIALALNCRPDEITEERHEG